MNAINTYVQFCFVHTHIHIDMCSCIPVCEYKYLNFVLRLLLTSHAALEYYYLRKWQVNVNDDVDVDVDAAGIDGDRNSGSGSVK